MVTLYCLYALVDDNIVIDLVNKELQKVEKEG